LHSVWSAYRAGTFSGSIEPGELHIAAETASRVHEDAVLRGPKQTRELFANARFTRIARIATIHGSQSEIQHFDYSRSRDHHVRRLQIPMHDPLLVRRLQSIGDLRAYSSAVSTGNHQRVIFNPVDLSEPGRLLWVGPQIAITALPA